MENPDKFNATQRKFGAPQSLIRAYDHWYVLLRPAQVTLGSLVLAARSEATAFSELSPPAFTELGEVCRDLEHTLSQRFACDRLNYLMLMMVDPHVHFHVIPRYKSPSRWREATYPDRAWPGPPQLAETLAMDELDWRALRDELTGCWPH